MKDWEQIYKEEGPVQIEPSEKIVNLVDFFKKEKVKKILDHGCGTGRHVKYLAEQGFNVIGTDYSEKALQHAKLLTSGLDNVELIQTDMDSIPYKDGVFDAIISNHVIQHALKAKMDKTFYEIERALKDNGLLFMSTISRKHRVYGKGWQIEAHTFIDIPELPDGKTPHHYFSEEELRKYLSRYEIIKLEHNSYPPDPDGFWKHGLEEWVLLARKI